MRQSFRPAAQPQLTTIQLQAGVYHLTRGGVDNSGSGGDLDVTNGDLTIIGAGQDLTTIQASMNDRVLHVHTGADSLDVRDLKISGGRRAGSSFSGSGAGIYTNGALSLTNVTLENNHADDDGGAIYSYGSAYVIVANSVFSDNMAGVSGGAIGLNGVGTSSITDSTFFDNESTGGSAWCDCHLSGRLEH